MATLHYKLKKWQYGFIYDDYKYKFLKSGWGTGKTLALILAAIKEAESYEHNLILVCRKEWVDLKDSTIKDFETYTGITVPSSRDVRLGTSTIMFRHLEELSKANLQNMNLGAFLIEQGEELENDEVFTLLCGRLRREPSSRRGYVIANAKGKNWIYKLKNSGLFAGGNRLDAHYSATTFDNQDNLPADYVMSLEAIKAKSPILYNRYVLNLDDEDDDSNCIIQRSWVEEATNKDIFQHDIRFITCDPAAEGNDETVIKSFKGTSVIDGIKHRKKNEMETCGILINYRKAQGAKCIVIDAIGIGSGIASRLEELKENVVRIKSSESPTDKDKYADMSTEMWIESADMFYNGEVSIPDDSDLKDQLCSRKYDGIASNGQYKIQSKKICKKLLGRSPDDADAVIMGLWAYKHDKVRHFDGDGGLSYIERYNRSVEQQRT